MYWSEEDLAGIFADAEPLELDGRRILGFVETPENRVPLFEVSVILTEPQATIRTADVGAAKRGSVLVRAVNRQRYEVREPINTGTGVTHLTLREV